MNPVPPWVSKLLSPHLGFPGATIKHRFTPEKLFAAVSSSGASMPGDYVWQPSQAWESVQRGH